MDLRCTNKKHGVVLVPASNADATIEIVCRSRWCGAGAGVVVIHRFSLSTGTLVNTFKFQAPPIEGRNGGA